MASFIKTQIGSATLYHGDSYEILPTLNHVGCIVTDPPYLFEASGGGRFRRNRQCMDDLQEAGLDKGFDHKIIHGWMCDSVIVFCHNDQLQTLIPHLAREFERHAVCMWHKSNPMPVANKHYKPDTEFYIHAWKKSAHPVGDLADKGRYFIGPVGKSLYDHPTVKPLPLIQKIIKNVNSDKVCDPFMGTGTTGVAALMAGKIFIGIEKDKKYFDIACQRIAAAIGDKNHDSNN